LVWGAVWTAHHEQPDRTGWSQRDITRPFIARRRLFRQRKFYALHHAGFQSLATRQHRDRLSVCERALVYDANQSPEPAAVGACSSAIAVHVASRRWLSFFR